MPGLKLYSVSDSPPTLSVRIALEVLGLEYTLIDVDFAGGEHLKEEYAKDHPESTIRVVFRISPNDMAETIFKADNLLFTSIVLPNPAGISLPGPLQCRKKEGKRKQARPSSPILRKAQEVSHCVNSSGLNLNLYGRKPFPKGPFHHPYPEKSTSGPSLGHIPRTPRGTFQVLLGKPPRVHPSKLKYLLQSWSCPFSSETPEPELGDGIAFAKGHSTPVSAGIAEASHETGGPGETGLGT
ncbi:unnamed protein product [Timema podura]|uniref:GST N-terminal domain-containing protein n=1 Tax=Timema podura TaxID=61482 RepID=A0ABN7NY68_TIMPD|nr:unnamed protein product [Timema podura]